MYAASWPEQRPGVRLAGGWSNCSSTGTAATVPAWTLVDLLVARVSPALRQAGDTETVRDGLAALRNGGNGAQLQRRVFDRTGSLDAVVDAIVARTTA